MDITSIRTFLAAAATGSFAGAAKRVNASPSSVTARIQQLEHRLGTALFVRDKRGCRLTPAGKRFLAPARQTVRSWELARYEVSLPERYERSLSFGGQYFLWDRFLMTWLDDARAALPDLALRVTAGAWARMNRDLAEGVLDMVVVHDPVLRRDIAARVLLEDELVLATAGDPQRWEEDFVRIEWGRSLGLQIASQLSVAPESGLVLDLGLRSVRWLVRNGKAGYLPRSMLTGQADAAGLQVVDTAPSFEFPAYVCWRSDLDEALANDVITTLREASAVSAA